MEIINRIVEELKTVKMHYSTMEELASWWNFCIKEYGYVSLMELLDWLASNYLIEPVDMRYIYNRYGFSTWLVETRNFDAVRSYSGKYYFRMVLPKITYLD